MRLNFETSTGLTRSLRVLVRLPLPSSLPFDRTDTLSDLPQPESLKSTTSDKKAFTTFS
jgi:hypothetical protein